MPGSEGSSRLIDVLAGLAFLLGLTLYGLRMAPPPTPREPLPAKWDEAGPVIGIDFGSRNLRVGFVVEGHVVKILDAQDGRRTIDSSVCVTQSDIIVGSTETPDCHDPDNNIPVRTLMHAMNFFETGYPEDPSTDFEELSMPAESLSTNTLLRTHPLTGITVIATVLNELRLMAEKYHARSISQAVITVPLEFTAVDRQTLTDAALLAGLSPIRLLHEPLAIALAYGLDRSPVPSGSYALVLDIGASAKVSLLRVDSPVITVVANAQNDTLGGTALNRLLYKYAADAYWNSVHDRLDDIQAVVLEDQVEVAKWKLSFAEQEEDEEGVVIALPIQDGPWFLVPLSVQRFNGMIVELLDDIVGGMVDDVLRSGGILEREISHIILAGGSSHIPALQRRTRERFHHKHQTLLSADEEHPDEAVVYGAAVFARLLALGHVPDEVKFERQNATAMEFGVEVGKGFFITVIPRNVALPARNTRRFSLTGRVIRIFTGRGEYTNGTGMEFVGSVVLPPFMDPARLKITFELSVYGVLNVTAVGMYGRSYSSLLQPRPPTNDELARMEAELAALADRQDLKRRMDIFHTHVEQSRPLLQRHLDTLPADAPQRALRAQIIDAMDSVDAWIQMHGGNESVRREVFFKELAGLEELLRQDVALKGGLPAAVPSNPAT
ncbi:heat shock protein 70 family [Mycena crocata]|nr:heat shock protein 70 family [Mycena crocata]